MKKQITRSGIFVLILFAVAFTAFSQQEKNKDKKEQRQNIGKKQDKPGKAGIDKPGKNNDQKTPGVQEKENRGVKDNKGNNAGINQGNKGNQDLKYGYAWNPVTFKDRHKIKNQGKVTLCHKFNSTTEPDVTIRVSSNALKAHMDHGDVMGECPPNSRFGNIFLTRRADYYNILQYSQEQVLYSNSILDYAVVRLADARLQLVTLQNNNAPVAEIERRQVVVVELEQNVSLLERLIGAATVLLANKLQ